jgi:hypothetical protein
MSNGTDTFAITNVARVDARQIRISGDLILTGKEKEVISWEIPASHASGDATVKPPARMPSPREIKWRLPGRDSEFYSRVKSYADAAGYNTLERDAPA